MGSALNSKSLRLSGAPAAKWIFPILLGVAFLIRFPFFFRDYIDRDESTFILMGQAWVDGHLPYTELWDIKPPLTFFFFAGIVYVFGKSFITIRLAGTLVVAAIGWFTYGLSARFGGRGPAFAAGLASVLLCSLFGSIQGVMSEHLLMGLYMGALWLLSGKESLLRGLLAGVLLGAALMVKTNIAFPILLVGLWWIYDAFRRYPAGAATARILRLALPGLAVILLTLLPYAFSGQAGLWWDSVIRAPLGYTRGSDSSPGAAWGVGLITLVLLIWMIRSGRLVLKKPGILLLFLSILGILWTFIQSGRVNTHYLIQLYPPLLVLLSIAFGPALQQVFRRYRPAVLGLMLLIPMESYIEYAHIVRYRAERGTFFNGEGFSVPAYLLENDLPSDDILFLEYHIGYWMLDAYPPVKAATHPSNLCKQEMFPYYNAPRRTAIQELRHLMQEVRPPIVVTRYGRRVFDKENIVENAYMDSVLSRQYQFLDTVDQAGLYSRIEP